jgi:hypothetical protein
MKLQGTHMSDNTQNIDLNLDKKKSKNKQNAMQGIEVLEFPNRTLPKLIEELLDKNIPVHLSKNGYYVGGFYGLNSENEHKGFAFAQDTNEANTLVFLDNKGHKHIIRSFEDLVKFHNHVWGIYFKISDSFKKPDNLWFGYMLQYGVLSITPGSIK